MPLQATSGAASYDGFGGGTVAKVNYIEDYFSTFLYSGAGTTQVINNGIDLSTNGGLVWLKDRGNVGSHRLVDTVRGNRSTLFSESTSAAVTRSDDVSCDVSSFNTNGFTAGNFMNQASNNYASWSWAKAPKFFDVQTWTGSGANRTISHSLGSVPACIMVKRTDTTGDWQVYHRSLANTEYLVLNSTAAKATGATRWNSTTPTSTEFSLGTDATVNSSASGATYVAYIFAHDAGGFGLTGTDNVISCGSFTTDGSGYATVNLGYEPQWVLTKATSAASSWRLTDTMRGYLGGVIPTSNQVLFPNTSGAETTTTAYNGTINATGFIPKMDVNTTFIYIAIRRGPMKVPTLGTSVYENTAYTGNNTAERKIGSSVLTDLLLLSNRDATATAWASFGQYIFDRLRGQDVSLSTSRSDAQTTGWDTYLNLDMNTGWDTGSTTDYGYLNKTSATYVSNAFRRAPSVFDIVCYTGSGVATTQTHNLGVVPELMIVKDRTASGYSWTVYSQPTGNNKVLILNNTDASSVDGSFNDTTPTSSVFSIAGGYYVNASGNNYVAYLFATCAGVSKVGSYTGTGTTKQIDCGFTAGARFVLIKRTDSTGDWYVWDTARGIVAGNDPYLLLNSTAAEVTSTDYIDTYSAGFEISSTAPAAINSSASGATYIFLAIA